jgi:hypothetical protein
VRDEAALVGEDHRLYPVAELEFGEDPANVGAYRAGSQPEVLRDLGVGPPAGDQDQYLAFPCGQGGQPFGSVRRGRRVADEVVDEPLGDAGSGDGFAGGDDADRGEEDSVTGADILNLLRELHTDGTTIVVITHSAEVAQAAHRRITLRDGLVAHDTGSIE